MRIPIVRGVAAAAAVLLLGWWATPAEAHDGEAIIEVDAAHEVPPNSVHYIVTVTWADDGHPAVEADVSATAVSPDGSEQVQGPLTLSNPDAGTYQGQLDLRPIPGDWEVTFAALNPEGTETATYTLPEQEQAQQPAEGSEQPGQGGEDSGSGDDAGSGDEASAGDQAGAEPETQSPEGDPDDVNVTEPEEDDDSPPLVLLAAVFVVLGAVVAGVFWLVVNRKSEGEAGGGGDGGRGGGGGDGTSDDGPDGAGATAAEPETKASAADSEADDSGAGADSEPAAR